jgi:hypothetical protein
MSETKLKGGRKGGATFPRIDLKQAVTYSKKLVSKTHTGAQPQAIIYPGVFGVTSSRGAAKASALKQFKLMKGNPAAFEATALAKSISVCPDDEVKKLLVQSLLSVNLFKTAFDTFKGDTVSGAKIKQQAASHNVHPDSLEEFLSIFTKSCIFSGIASKDGENITFVLDEVIQSIEDQIEDETDDDLEDEIDEEIKDDKDFTDNHQDAEEGENNSRKSQRNTSNPRQKADIQIKIDPSMDPEKLEKLLAVLKKYGQL